MLMNAQDYLLEVKAGRNPFEQRLIEKTETCTACGVVLQEAITGYRRFADLPYCSDDYFEQLGAIVERHPLGFATSRGA